MTWSGREYSSSPKAVRDRERRIAKLDYEPGTVITSEAYVARRLQAGKPIDPEVLAKSLVR